MPIQTGFGDLTIGKDITIDIVLRTGRILRLGNVTSFDRKPVHKKINSDGIDGVPKKGVIPGGWELMLDVDREHNEAELWWDDYERRYYDGEAIQNVTVTETITEGDGSITQFRYEGVALHLDDAGAYKGDSNVKMKLKGEASFRRRIV